MINKIIEMLEREERVALELVVSHEDYVNKNHVAIYEREAIAKSSLVVTSVLGGGAALELEDSQYCIPEKDYKYFKIKESTPTFNDLIDVAVKAWKDGFLKVLELEKGIVDQVFTVIDGIAYAWHDGDDDYSRALDTIKSLYAETFVIESEEDIEKLCDDAEITLANNEKGIFNNCSGLRSITNLKTGFEVHGLNIFWLKGATVTQKRGDS